MGLVAVMLAIADEPNVDGTEPRMQLALKLLRFALSLFEPFGFLQLLLAVVLG